MPLTYSTPSQQPEWDPNPGDVVDPGAPKKALGWQASEAPAAETFNWLFNRIYLWTRYLADVVANVIDVEHVVAGASGGKHRKVTYSAARSVRWNLGNPTGSHWRLATGGTETLDFANLNATPGGTTAVEWTCFFRPFNVGSDDSSGSPQYTVTSIAATTSIVNNGSTASVVLYSVNRTTGAVVTEHTYALTHTSGVVARQAVTGLSIAIDPAKVYFVRFNADSFAAAGDVKFYNVEIIADRSRLE